MFNRNVNLRRWEVDVPAWRSCPEAKLITGDDEFSGSAAAVLVYVSVSNNKCDCTDC